MGNNWDRWYRFDRIIQNYNSALFIFNPLHMLTKKQKLGVLAVVVVLLGGLTFASFSSANDLQGKVRGIFRGPRNVGTEQVRQVQNNYDVRQGRNRDDGPPEPPPPISNLGDIDVPPPEVSSKGFDWIE